MAAISKWDWEDLSRLVLAGLFVALSGVLLAFVGGYLAVRLVFEALFGGLP